MRNYPHIISEATQRTTKRWTGVGDKQKLIKFTILLARSAHTSMSIPAEPAGSCFFFSHCFWPNLVQTKDLIINDKLSAFYQNVRLRRRCGMWTGADGPYSMPTERMLSSFLCVSMITIIRECVHESAWVCIRITISCTKSFMSSCMPCLATLSSLSPADGHKQLRQRGLDKTEK